MERTKKITIALILGLSGGLLGACGVEKSGVEITSRPIAKVYLNNKESGMTPYKNNSLKPGEVKVKLDDGKGNEWERNLKLENNVTTVINRNFEGEEESGYVLSMEKSGEKGSILVNSDPEGAMISIDGEIKSQSPGRIEQIKGGDRKVSIGYPGYKSLNFVVKVVDNYRLVIDAKLGREEEVVVSPTPTKVIKNWIKIKATETGWLRVRTEAKSSSAEIGRVTPGEKYELIKESPDWYQIIFGDKIGWISTKYGEKISE